MLVGVVDMAGVFVAQRVLVAKLLTTTYDNGSELVCLTSMGPTRFDVPFATEPGVKKCGFTVQSSGTFSRIYKVFTAFLCFGYIIRARVVWSIWNLKRVFGHRMRDSHVFPATMVRIHNQAVRNIIDRAIMERTMCLHNNAAEGRPAHLTDLILLYQLYMLSLP